MFHRVGAPFLFAEIKLERTDAKARYISSALKRHVDPWSFEHVRLYRFTALPLNRFRPAVEPLPSTCGEMSIHLLNETVDSIYFSPYIPKSKSDSSDGQNDSLSTVRTFSAYRRNAKLAVERSLPESMQHDKVVDKFTEFFISVSGEAQLHAAIEQGRVTGSSITSELADIHKHSHNLKISHGEMKAFTAKLFDSQLKPSAATAIGVSGDHKYLRDDQIKILHANSAKDSMFIEYFKIYYNGKFIDRFGTSYDAPKIAMTIEDAEITAAETILLEFLVDVIDRTPVMGSTASVDSTTKFYPGGTTNIPTVYTVMHKQNPGIYIQIPSSSNCGITPENVWILKALADGASDQAGAVGGLIANTPGGISLGLGIVGKISVGDNQTL